MINQGIKVHIPSNFNLDKLIKEFPSSRGFKPKDYKVHSFLNLLHENRGRQESHRAKYGDYSFLHSHRLKKLYGDEVRIMIDWLKYAGVIESDNHYEIGERSKGYRLTEEYRHAPPVEKIIKKSTLIRKLKQKSRVQKNTEAKFDYLNTFIDGLQIDVVSAEQSSWDYYQETRRNYPKQLEEYESLMSEVKCKTKSIKKPTNPACRLHYDLNQINKIESKDYTFVQDDTSNRLHTNLTSIRSDLRNYITYEGDELVSIDYINSQPLISSALLNPNFFLMDDVFLNETHTKLINTPISCTISSNSDDIMFNCKDVAPNIYDVISGDVHNYVTSTSSIMIPEMDTGTVNTGGYSYKELCEKGELYEYLTEVALPSFTSTGTLTRQEVKALVFQMMFTSNKFIGQDAAEPKRIFRKLFPYEYNLFASVKRKGHANLPVLLQKIESKLMLERIVPRIHDQRPDIPIFTIHDSIVTTVGNQDYVERVMLEEMKAALGLNALTKIDYWRPSNKKLN